MRVLVVVAGFRGWALDRLYSPLQSYDVDVKLMYEGIDEGEWSRYDVIHFTYYGLYYEQLRRENIDPDKCIVTVHHIPQESLSRIVDGLTSAPPAMRTRRFPVTPTYTPLVTTGKSASRMISKALSAGLIRSSSCSPVIVSLRENIHIRRNVPQQSPTSKAAR